MPACAALCCACGPPCSLFSVQDHHHSPAWLESPGVNSAEAEELSLCHVFLGLHAVVADAKAERCLRIFGATEIAGTKWCGKAWCALRHAKSVSYVDENLALAVDGPAAMLVGERLHVIDGWQRVPVRYDRDSSGLEADAVIKLADGRWAAFEIKTSESKLREGVASLKRLREKLAANPSSGPAA